MTIKEEINIAIVDTNNNRAQDRKTKDKAATSKIRKHLPIFKQDSTFKHPPNKNMMVTRNSNKKNLKDIKTNIDKEQQTPKTVTEAGVATTTEDISVDLIEGEL